MKINISFLIGLITGMVVMNFILQTMIVNYPKHDILHNAAMFCDKQGFNYFKIDGHGNVLCENIQKNN